MQDTVRAYTRDLVAAFAAQGTPVDISQNGNEITYGFLVPVGAIYRGPTGLNWPDFTSLVNAGVVGAKQGAGTRGIQIMIHIHPGDSASWTRWWFDNFVQYGVPFDIIGVSYYPFMAGGLSSLLYNVSSNRLREVPRRGRSANRPGRDHAASWPHLLAVDVGTDDPPCGVQPLAAEQSAGFIHGRDSEGAVRTPSVKAQPDQREVGSHRDQLDREHPREQRVR